MAVAADMGADAGFSMLRTMDEAYKIRRLQERKLAPLMSYCMMTLGNARALGLDHAIGGLDRAIAETYVTGRPPGPEG